MSNYSRSYGDKRYSDEPGHLAPASKRVRGHADGTSRSAHRNSYVLVGTEIPAPDEKDTGQFVPEWRQEVRDEQGRRRFHGAFTGGFSAGYFNTVGSKEGWAPSDFVSSRKQRAQRDNQRVEDFMDEEDIAQQAENERLVAKDTFAGQGAIERVHETRKAIQDVTANTGELSDLTARIMEDLLVVPSKETIGTQLLRRMGWQEGQGVGPRQPMQLTVVDDEDDEDGNHSYSRISAPSSTSSLSFSTSTLSMAPIEVNMVEFKDKKDTYGLGFTLTTLSGEAAQSLNQLTNIYNSHGNNNHHMDSYQSKSTQSLNGFGLAIRDDEDNDAIIYDTPHRSQFNMTLVDDEDNDEPNYNRSIPTKLKTPLNSAPKASVHRKVQRSAVGHDGRPPISGYHLMGKSTTIEHWFEPPSVPESYDEFHVFNEPGPDGQAPTQRKPAMTAEQRGQILGETPLEGPKRSVFDYMSSTDRERLERISGGQKEGKEEQVEYIVDTQPTSIDDAPFLDGKEARAALEGYMPFGDQPAKQTRYRRFLEVKAGKASKYLPTPTTDDDRDKDTAMQREFREFIQAARIFKPVAAPMAARFTSASVASDIIPPVKTGLVTASDRVSTNTTTNTTARHLPPIPVKNNAAVEAAAMGMFGALTRTTQPFIPERLLCKRFNLPVPLQKHTHPE